MADARKIKGAKIEVSDDGIDWRELGPDVSLAISREFEYGVVVIDSLSSFAEYANNIPPPEQYITEKLREYMESRPTWVDIPDDVPPTIDHDPHEFGTITGRFNNAPRKLTGDEFKPLHYAHVGGVDAFGTPKLNRAERRRLARGKK